MKHSDDFDFDDLAELRAETAAEDADYRGEADLTNYPENFDEVGPFFVIVNTDPPKPPYGSPERADYDREHGDDCRNMNYPDGWGDSPS